jgi:phosphohistidine phosphatase
MKTVILFRHGKAEEGDFNTRDFDRCLKERGEKDSKMMAQKLIERNTVPQLIIHSGAVRAEQTAEIIAHEIGLSAPMRIVPWIYTGYSTGEFLDLIHSLSGEIDTVAVVGHNPNITEIAVRLCRDFRVSFPTSANLTVAFDVKSWMNVEANQGKMVAFEFPKLYK